MAENKDAALVRRGYEAFSTGDSATLTEIIAADATQFQPGSGELAGEQTGGRRSWSSTVVWVAKRTARFGSSWSTCTPTVRAGLSRPTVQPANDRAAGSIPEPR